MEVIYWIYFALIILVLAFAIVVALRFTFLNRGGPEIIWGSIWGLGTLAFYLILTAAGWFPSDNEQTRAGCGEPHGLLRSEVLERPETLCGGLPLRYEYCEHFVAERLMQPLGTISDLAFMAAAFWVLVLVARDERIHGGHDMEHRPNPMRGRNEITWSYAAIVMFMGPGSMVLHASMRDTEGFLDALSVVMWAAFGGAYTTVRLIGLSRCRLWFERFLLWVLWAAFIALFIGVGLTVPDSIMYLQMGAGGWFGLAEVIFLFVSLGAHRKRPIRHTLMNLLTIALAFLFWGASGVASYVFCVPTCADQPHALFHMLAAAVTLTAFLTFRSETSSV